MAQPDLIITAPLLTSSLRLDLPRIRAGGAGHQADDERLE